MFVDRDTVRCKMEPALLREKKLLQSPTVKDWADKSNSISRVSPATISPSTRTYYCNETYHLIESEHNAQSGDFIEAFQRFFSYPVQIIIVYKRFASGCALNFTIDRTILSYK